MAHHPPAHEMVEIWPWLSMLLQLPQLNEGNPQEGEGLCERVRLGRVMNFDETHVAPRQETGARRNVAFVPACHITFSACTSVLSAVGCREAGAPAFMAHGRVCQLANN